MTNKKFSRSALLTTGVAISALGVLAILLISSGASTGAQIGSALTVDALVNPLDTAIAGSHGEAILLVTVQSSSGLAAGLTQADFTLDTHIVPSGAGQCPIMISQFFGEYKPGIYLFGVTPIQGCNWALGEYDITVIVSSDGTEGLALSRFSIEQ